MCILQDRVIDKLKKRKKKKKKHNLLQQGKKKKKNITYCNKVVCCNKL